MITVREVGDFLKAHGVSPIHASTVYKQYKAETIKLLTENPYLLPRAVRVDFTDVDKFAKQLRFDMKSLKRVEGWILCTLDEHASQGHVYVDRDTLDLLGPQFRSQLEDAIDELVEDAEVTTSAGRVYLPDLYGAEVSLANNLLALASRGFSPISPPSEAMLAGLAPAQRGAVAATAESAVVVVTGGPGVGKTHIIRAVTDMWIAAGKTVTLCAPTGRAAKRMAESTGRSASTIHRLLEYRPDESGEWTFARNEDAPLYTDLVIVDEASMCDVSLAAALVRALPSDASLLLVGDVNQLPSVGPGRVLDDVIASGRFPVSRLTQVFRQAAGSKIVGAAHDILAGRVPEGCRGPGGDFYTPFAGTGEAAKQRILDLVTNVLPKQFGFQPNDVQVLTPMHRGEAGTTSLNLALQAALNPAGQLIERKWGKSTLRVGDRVLQTRNDYNAGVFNGDTGRIVGRDGGMTKIAFEGADGALEVEYTDRMLTSVEPAYAMTIHKAQGGQAPAVLMALLPEHSRMLRRNLFYTGVTRARKLAMVVGHSWAISKSVATAEVEHRNTALKERLAG